MFKRNIKKLNTKAFTLVEVLLAVALLAIAALGVGSVIINTQNTASDRLTESDLQSQMVEVQETLQSEILGATLGIRYCTKSDFNSDFETAYSYEDGNGKYEKLIAFYSVDSETRSIAKKYYRWNAEDDKLYVAESKEPIGRELRDGSTMQVDPNINQTMSSIDEWTVIAYNVDNFNFDVSNYNISKLVSYELNVKKDGVKYPADQVVSVRNDIAVNSDNLQLIGLISYPSVRLKAESPIYNGAFQDLVTYSDLVGGTLRFYASKEDVTPNDDQLTSGVCQGLDAGAYNVWYKIVADSSGNYRDTDVLYFGVVEIAKAPGRVDVEPATGLSYTGAEQDLIVKIENNTGTVYFRVGEAGEWIDEIPKRKSAGEYRVYYYAEESENYLSTDKNAHVDVIILPAEPSVNITMVHTTCSDEYQDMVKYSDLVGDDILFYISTSDEQPTEDQVINEECQAKGYGTYYVWYRIITDVNGNYSSSKIVGPGTATISHYYFSSVSKSPTCVTSGVMFNRCGGCGHSYNSTISATGVHVKMRLDINGTPKYVCRTCGAFIAA